LKITVNRGGINDKGQFKIRADEPTEKNYYFYRKLKDIGIGGLIGAGVVIVIG
jgi:hypothetical protein